MKPFGLSLVYHYARKIKRKLFPLKRSADSQTPSLQGNLAAAKLDIVPTKRNTRIVGSNWLINFQNNEASEHGEDGIVAKIFQILKPENKWVCEFGAHDPEVISNTHRLIHQEGWHAVLIEADETFFKKLAHYYKNSSTVYCLNTKVSYEGEQTLDELLKKTPIPHHLDFMVIDIDGNDYHVWEAIETYQAKVVMIEFNASIPNSVSFVQPRDLTINQGASLRALTELAKKKGYQLIAVTSWNAFFVQSQYYSLFFKDEPPLDEMYVFPAKHPIEMRPFQLYDGTIVIGPYDKMLWHRIDLKSNDYQVLPAAMRIFSRKDWSQKIAANPVKNNKYLERIFRMPGNRLSEFAHNHFSLYGEDGILEKCLTFVQTDVHFLVDVGAWDGMTHSRSRNLVARHRWNGLLIEEDPAIAKQLKKNNRLQTAKVLHQPYALDGDFALDHLFELNKVPQDFEVLFLNTYGMEYYLWESLKAFAPKLVVAQFNPTIPNDVHFIQAKDFTLHQGCSLRALCDLAHYKGYELVAVTLETAFFVKRKYFYRFFETLGLQQADLDEIFCPIEMKMFQLYDGTLALRGLDHLMWHDVTIDEEPLQVVPKSLRKFHQFANPEEKRLYYRV